MDSEKIYTQGITVQSIEDDFLLAIEKAVDYRGDTTLELQNGEKIEGYLFNFEKDQLNIYPKDSEQITSIELSNVRTLHFSGKDMAEGKSWEAWVAKKEAEKANK